MDMALFSGTAHPALVRGVAEVLGVEVGQATVERFPDGESHVEIRESVRGREVYLIQPTGPPVERNLFELLLLGDACLRAGASEVVAIVPYFGYARQDRRSGLRTPLAARVVANLFQATGFARLVAVDLHSPPIEGFFDIPVEHVSAFDTLLAQIRPRAAANCVVVSPDLGAAKLADRYSAALGCPTAVVHKTRVSGAEVRATRVTGDVRGRVPIIVDDMISTGGTVMAALEQVLAAGAEPPATVVATHGLFSGDALRKLAALPIDRVIVTDSLPLTVDTGALVHVAGLAPLLAETIKRLHARQSLAGLLSHA
jgi:ribose-phosphate pyrophosphokinase